MLKKYATLFLPLFIILPVLKARFYHGYDSYTKYYKNHVNGEKYLMISKMAEPDYKKKNVQNMVKYFEENKSNQPGFKIDFVFPDDDRLRNDGSSYIETRINENMLRCDNSQHFCENVRNYPEELVNRILKENSDLYAYAFEDTIPIDQRFDSNDVKLCPSTEKLITPKEAESIKGEWLFIVQSKEMNFQQRIRVETCQNVNSSCEIIHDELPEGYYPRCNQIYISRELIAINNNTETVRETFQFPVNCCCHLYFHTN